MTNTALIPVWLSIPIATLLAITLISHLHITRRSDHPASRKRIRTANAVVMLLNLPLLVCGFSLINPESNPRVWVLIWLTAMVLLAFSVSLAVLDMLNTARLARRASREIGIPLRSISHHGHQGPSAP